MIEELTFGKNGTEFVISQNISLDDLIEGKPIERAYELILYNPVSLMSDLPEIYFESCIRMHEGGDVVSLTTEIAEINSGAEEAITFALGGLGAAVGSIGGVWPALFGSVLGSASGYLLNKRLSSILGYFKVFKGKSTTERIIGTHFDSDTEGLIPINDKVRLCFGTYRFDQRLVRSDKNDAAVEMAVKRIRNIVESKLKESEKFDELIYYSDILAALGLQRSYIKIQNVIEIKSGKRRTRLYDFVGNEFFMGNLVVDIPKHCPLAKIEAEQQVRNAFYEKSYFFENSVKIHIDDFLNDKKTVKKIKLLQSSRNHGDLAFALPFSLGDGEDIELLGIITLESKSNLILGGYYINVNTGSVQHVE